MVVDVPEAGTLDRCIEAAGKNIAELRNLKLTGKINSRDFAVMRYLMKKLAALNLKEVEIVANPEGGYIDEPEQGYSDNADDMIPVDALWRRETLVTLVLPDKLKTIRSGAFNGCRSLSGSLIIPEGVEVIENGAFNGCTSLTGTLSLPSTLKRLGTEQGYMGIYDGVFPVAASLANSSFPMVSK